MTYRGPGRALTFGIRCGERGQGDAEEPDSLGDGKQGFEQRIAQLFEFASGPDQHLTGVASRDLPEVGKLDFERDGAPTSAGAFAVLPNLANDLSKLISHCVVGE